MKHFFLQKRASGKGMETHLGRLNLVEVLHDVDDAIRHLGLVEVASPVSAPRSRYREGGHSQLCLD